VPCFVHYHVTVPSLHCRFLGSFNELTSDSQHVLLLVWFSTCAHFTLLRTLQGNFKFIELRDLFLMDEVNLIALRGIPAAFGHQLGRLGLSSCRIIQNRQGDEGQAMSRETRIRSHRTQLREKYSYVCLRSTSGKKVK
jgi:hypothetical protein